jgi:protein gp37
MGKESSIAWTDATWNIAVGCKKVDADCLFCYMYRDSMNGTRYNPREIRRTKTVFNLPLKLKEPSKIFTSSLTDFFIEEIDEYRKEAWDIIRKCPQHTFQILTKRPDRIGNDTLPHDHHYENGQLVGGTMIRNLKNVWLGTSCGSQDSLHRMESLIHSTWKGLKFLSLEPLHGRIDLEAHLCGNCGNPTFDHGIDWVIVGGESGNDKGKYRYRPCEIEWIELIIEFCRLSGVPVFVKQLGTHLAKKMGLKDRHGGEWSEWPEHLRIRQFPK